ncbi:SAM-dependent methyltransferase [Candidatus Peregrinibacteria bacterium]|nr:SAM-dependent methyltransferase [Candidatus Peregrinibacteria bacterium]
MTATELHDLLFGSVQGYSLSASGRAKVGREADPILTYGEITPESVQYMMEIANPQTGEIFYDLGSGTGKAVILAAFVAPFRRATGVELIEDLFQSASESAARYHSEVKPLHPEKMEQEVNFVHGSMFDHDTSDGDVFFTHCTCFDDPMMDQISKKLEACKPGTRVITVTKGLTSPEFDLVHSAPYRLGWGEATLCFYRRK